MVGRESMGWMCDGYHDPRLCETGGTRTRFIIKPWEMTYDYARLALNFYNEKLHKNFNLEQVVKLNRIALAYYGMTFKARDTESGESCLFRGVVYVVGGPKVYLCEIMDEKEISIPADHDEFYQEEDNDSDTRSESDCEDGSAVGSDAVSCCSDVDAVGRT